jgi:hypothetical protein
MKASVENAVDYPKFVNGLTVAGWILTLAVLLLNDKIELVIFWIVIGTLPLTLLISLRNEHLSYAESFSRSWIDLVQEHTNSILLIGGLGAAAYGFSIGFLFGLLTGFMYIVIICLVNDLSLRISRKIYSSRG